MSTIDSSANSDHLSLDQLFELDQPFLSINFGRLRALVTVKRVGSIQRAATELAKDYASIKSQLDALNSYFEHLCGQKLVAKPKKRGEDAVFTDTGNRVAKWAEELLATWHRNIDSQRSRVGETVTIATTAFTLPILGKLWTEFRETLSCKISPRMLQLRTSDFHRKMASRDIDLGLAGVTWANGKPDVPDGYTFEPWVFDKLLLLTNIPKDQLPSQSIHLNNLPGDITLILPEAGVIRNLVDSMFESVQKPRPTELVTISDVYYGLSVLRFGLVEGAMFVAESVGRLVTSTPPTFDRTIPERNLRFISLAPLEEDFKIAAGLLGRTDDIENLSAEHPIKIFWRIFKKHAPGDVQ